MNPLEASFVRLCSACCLSAVISSESLEQTDQKRFLVPFTTMKLFHVIVLLLPLIAAGATVSSANIAPLHLLSNESFLTPLSMFAQKMEEQKVASMNLVSSHSFENRPRCDAMIPLQPGGAQNVYAFSCRLGRILTNYYFAYLHTAASPS